MFLSAFLARELAPSHRRIVEAARNAIKATVTTGLAASMQIIGSFGPLFAFRIGQPGVSLGIFEGVVVIICAAAMQAAIVPITGKLLDYPGLVLGFLFLVFAAIPYLLSNTRFFLPLALVAIGTITTVYIGIFEPGVIGWGSTYTFDGILAATLVMVAVDTYIWPSPLEPKLLDSIAADLEHIRRRFTLVGQRYLDPFSPLLLPPQAKSKLTPNLALLNSVREHTKPAPQRVVALLDLVMTTEHLYLEVERLAVLADEPTSDELRQRYRTEVESALRILDAALAEEINRVVTGFVAIDKDAQWILELSGVVRQLSALNARTSSNPDESAMNETLNFLGFLGGLEAVANLLQPQEHPATHAAVEPSETSCDVVPRSFIDPARLRFSIKLGATITLGLLVGLTTQRADLQTILWSIVVAGQPNQYGAVVRKTILRLAGCIMSGIAALAAMLIVSQNFDSLPPYLIPIFVVSMFSTYIAQSSEWLGYASIQTGMTFLICYVGLAPSSDIYKPLWRFWGIVLGVLTTGFVFLVLWPEYAGQKVIENLAKLTQTTLSFARDIADRRVTYGLITEVEKRLSANLLDVLNMADQAKLEGRCSAANAAAAVEAASIVIRIAYRFYTITRARQAGSELDWAPGTPARYAALEHGCCAWLELELEKIKAHGSLEQPEPATHRARELTNIRDGLVISGRLEGLGWPAEVRSNRTLQLEAYRRLPTLLSQFESVLSRLTCTER